MIPLLVLLNIINTIQGNCADFSLVFYKCISKRNKASLILVKIELWERRDCQKTPQCITK